MTDRTPSPDDRLSIEVTRTDDDAPCFVLTGEVDPHTAPALQERLDPELSGGATQVVFDMAEVSFVDSAGLRVIADTQRQLSEAGGQLTIQGATSGLRKLLAVTGLDEHVRLDS